MAERLRPAVPVVQRLVLVTERRRPSPRVPPLLSRPVNLDDGVPVKVGDVILAVRVIKLALEVLVGHGLERHPHKKLQDAVVVQAGGLSVQVLFDFGDLCRRVRDTSVDLENVAQWSSQLNLFVKLDGRGIECHLCIELENASVVQGGKSTITTVDFANPGIDHKSVR